MSIHPTTAWQRMSLKLAAFSKKPHRAVKKIYLTEYGKHLKYSSSNLQFRSYRAQTPINFHQEDDESIADLHARLILLLAICNYNQHFYEYPIKLSYLYMQLSTFAVHSWARNKQKILLIASS